MRPLDMIPLSHYDHLAAVSYLNLLRANNQTGEKRWYN